MLVTACNEWNHCRQDYLQFVSKENFHCAITANVYVYDGLGFRSASLYPLPNEIKKTKLQIYTETQAGINILL